MQSNFSNEAIRLIGGDSERDVLVCHRVQVRFWAWFGRGLLGRAAVRGGKGGERVSQAIPASVQQQERGDQEGNARGVRRKVRECRSNAAILSRHKEMVRDMSISFRFRLYKFMFNVFCFFFILRAAFKAYENGE